MSRSALARYVAAWLAAGVVAAVLIVAVVRQQRRAPKPRSDPLAAVVHSGCVLEAPRGRRAAVSRPPVGARRGRPPRHAARDGIYDHSPPPDRLVGALHRGVVVVQYRPTIPGERIAAVRRTFAAPSPRRIVTPDRSGMSFAIAATAWGRVLGCSKVDDEVLRGIRAFAQRYAGTGPGG